MDEFSRRDLTKQIEAARPPRAIVDPWRPYLFFVESEYSRAGRLEPVATLFLTNRECPFRCVFCDLWKHTTTTTVPLGAIPAQIDFALAQLPPAAHIKLYNSGNFFDVQAIPAADHPAIAARLQTFQTVIVENHPRLCGPACLRFRDGLPGQLEIAVGLETIHPEVLPRLNKQMTVADFDRAAEFLQQAGIDLRVFVLLRPPGLSEQEGVDWAVRSVEHAFRRGARCVAIIPVRAGNGILDQWQDRGLFAPPGLRALEQAVEAGLQLAAGRVWGDLWDVERLEACQLCRAERIARVRIMNESQQIPSPVHCSCS